MAEHRGWEGPGITQCLGLLSASCSAGTSVSLSPSGRVRHCPPPHLFAASFLSCPVSALRGDIPASSLPLPFFFPLSPSLEPRPFPLGFPQTHPRDVPLRKMLHPSPTTLTLLVLQISAPNLFWDPHSHQFAFHRIPHITPSIWATRDLWVLSVLCSDPTDV